MADTIVNFGTGVGTLKKIYFDLTPIDALGNAAPVEAGTWSLNETVAGSVKGVIEGVDGNVLKVSFEKGDLGGLPASTSEYEASADADQTSGVKMIYARFILNHVAAEAVGLGVVSSGSVLEEDTTVPADGVIV